MGWEPVLDGPLADAAACAVRDIGEAITAGAPEDRVHDHVLFWAYAAGTFDDAATAAAYDAATERLLARVERGYADLSLYGGLTGAGFVLAHVSDDGAEEFLAGVDEIVIDALAVERWTADYDLIQGLTGLGVYFLERLAGAAQPPSARAGLERVVDQLAALAVTGADGTTWHTGVELLPPWQAERAPAGYDNLGVAHGVAGTIGVLGRIAAVPDAPPRARELVAGATRWLRAHELPPTPRGRYPSWLTGGPGDREPSRTAWCYGDPGLALALWSAAARTGGAVEPWRALAAESAARPEALCGVRDPGLCHGSIGLAHLYNRAYQASGDPAFRAAARTWFEHGLAQRVPGAGVAGFRTYWVDPITGAPGWRDSRDFLEGACGIGLALLAGVTAEEPRWDRLLVCDVPPRETT
jgi:hypothetical protein